MEKQRITVQVLNGATGEVREVVARVTADDEQTAINMLFTHARTDDYYYRFLGMGRVINPDSGTSVEWNNQTYWAKET